jgi:hypothetical protein
MTMTTTKTPRELAEIIVSMSYGDLLSVATMLHDMNADENEGLRDMKSKYGMAETLFDWAEATVEECEAADEEARKARLAQPKTNLVPDKNSASGFRVA